jgi:hypothetical protein
MTEMNAENNNDVKIQKTNRTNKKNTNMAHTPQNQTQGRSKEIN